MGYNYVADYMGLSSFI